MTGFTEADFNSWRFNRDAVHFNGGSAFFGHGHRCVDQPRLLVIDKFFKATRSSQRSYMVDGTTRCATLAEALAALDRPPQPSAEQLALLRTLSREWSEPQGRIKLLPLADMGLIEWGRDEARRVTCRLTEAGVALRPAHDSGCRRAGWFEVHTGRTTMGGMMAPAYLFLIASPIVIPVFMAALVAVFGIVTLIARGFGL